LKFSCSRPGWKPIFTVVYSNASELNSVLSALHLLDGEWGPLDAERSSLAKIAVRECARFMRSFDHDSPQTRPSRLLGFAWSSSELVKDLLDARRDDQIVRALSALVKHLPRLIGAIGLARRRDTRNMSIEDLLAIVTQYETPEVEWFRASIRAVLRREALDDLRNAPVAVEAAVLGIATEENATRS
jgi:hypothetical protein